MKATVYPLFEFGNNRSLAIDDILMLIENYLKWEYWFIATDNIRKPFRYIQKLVLLMKRNTMYKHDFLVQLQNISHPSCTKRIRRYIYSISNKPYEVIYLLYHFQSKGLVVCGMPTFGYHMAWIMLLNIYTNLIIDCNKYTRCSQGYGGFSEASFMAVSNTSRVISVGGGHSHNFSYPQLSPFILLRDSTQVDVSSNVFIYKDHVDDIGLLKYPESHFIHVRIPFCDLMPYISKTAMMKIAKSHGIVCASHDSKDVLLQKLEGHSCPKCNLLVSVFSIETPAMTKKQRQAADIKKRQILRQKQKHIYNTIKNTKNDNYIPYAFPPEPLNDNLGRDIVEHACKRSDYNMIEEAGCAVCGELTSIKKLTRLKGIKNHLHLLKANGVTSIERKHERDAKREYSGPVLDHKCNKVCDTCRRALRVGRVPRLALAQGLWLGEVPEQLSGLRFIEKLLIARVRHTTCFIKIATGGRKMKANVVCFENPVSKIFDHLPPPKEELDEVLAVLFTGPAKPTEDDYKRSLLLVRRNYVANALIWLKLNHVDYADINISYKNLAEYPEDGPPVYVDYKVMSENKTPESISVFDMDKEDGIEEGDCAYSVHGITGEQLNTMTTNRLKAIALKHLNNQGKFLVVGHDNKPESTWDNPHLYPKMFPWLFPYGMGGIGPTLLSDKEHKRHLLMYHDKRFQLDISFPFVAFSHEQVKKSTTHSFLLADKNKFQTIADRLLNLDQSVLSNLIDRMAAGEHMKADTEEQKACFRVINDLDHISGHVDGSMTSKKYMRNEIWSLIAHCGAPSWYITLSPADNKHPICVYFAETNTTFEPKILPNDERLRTVIKNPVASARFFDFVVNTFIESVLGVGTKHRGLYGDTEAYYGTVEQQGRLSLHLHLLLWIKGSLTPQETREKIMDPNSEWRKGIINWIESCHTGDYLTGCQEDVLQHIAQKKQSTDYVDPTESLPLPPPSACQDQNQTAHVDSTCEQCTKVNTWWEYFRNVVDDILTKSNIHKCNRNKNKDGSINKKHTYTGCMDNKWGKCKARFPRPLFKQTVVDTETGALNIKKNEPWINTFTPVITYIFRCNTDVTCLMSGTAIKAVILYVSDYITKPVLKTHVIFDSIKSIFTKNADVLNSTLPGKEKARRIMSKIVNLLSAKTEMGAPMISMYLLGNPDHYTSHKYISFYWKIYVTEARRYWYPEESNETSDKVALIRHKNKIIGISSTYDYVYRPTELEDMSLYEWIRRCKRVKTKISKSRMKKGDDTPDDGARVDDLSLSDSENKDKSTSAFIDKNTDHTRASKSLKPFDYKFLKSHPLYDSYHVKVFPDNPYNVVNFIGDTLPRCDRGDREYYCCTMLTLFKPWRTGKELKNESRTWHDTFSNHIFGKREMEIIKNFNIKYECLDARDDYRSQLKKGDIVQMWMNDDMDDIENIADSIPEKNYMQSNDDDDIPTHMLNIGRGELRRRREMQTIRNIMTNIGWTAEHSEGLPNDLDLNPAKPKRNLSSLEWKKEIAKKKAEAIELRNQGLTSNVSTSSLKQSSVPNVVKIADKSYLEKDKHQDRNHTDISNIVSEYQLNAEQERAFCIIAQHASDHYAEPLRMYLGGMGGTGKSQVLKAVSKFFKDRNESHRFVVVAPTGSAAALLGGSTYHSMFGINEKNQRSASNLAQVCGRLLGVEYVFLDEVSMLSAHDLYKISSQIALAMNAPDMPFGGLNMVFAGDFAQLPPVPGGEYSSLYSRRIGTISSNLRSQEEAMGKALWHHVTTVVILRQNMRQKSQTVEDTKLRTALENMRYKACTSADIGFLNTLINSPFPGHKSVCDKQFRNVSVITAHNIHKDEINRLGTQRFAAETGQTLTDFYSDDSRAGPFNKNTNQSVLHVNNISDELQEFLWNQPEACTDKHIPGKLSLCVGLPVMIRSNLATELCITRGQEAVVYGWNSSLGSRGQRVLDTLFVKLINPPSTVTFDGLPENVVPVYKTSTSIYCTLTDDTKVYITRSQVELLPNFSMTDYSSQGKTRVYNVVDLNNSKNHQSYYTALSRGATAAGTLILQGFHHLKITGGASGALRQEFRELELLDDITKLRYEHKLHRSVYGEHRNTLIASFRHWKGLHYVPRVTHTAIRWNSKDPLLETDVYDIPWKIVMQEKNKKDKYTKQHHSNGENNATVLNRLKRKMDDANDEHLSNKRSKMVDTLQILSNHTTNISLPEGIVWSNNSCAYDAVFVVLHAIWLSLVSTTTTQDADVNTATNKLMEEIFEGFHNHQSKNCTLEQLRDDIRHSLSSIRGFAWGSYTSAIELLSHVFKTDHQIYSSRLACPHGHTVPRRPQVRNSCLLSAGTSIDASTAEWMRTLQEKSHSRCQICSKHLLTTYAFSAIPPVLALDFEGLETNISPVINVYDNCGRCSGHSLHLKGIIYYADGHYTSRTIYNQDQIWFHDGILTGQSMLYDGAITSSNDIQLSVCRGKKAIAAIYMKSNNA
jgi:hypothetical protein